MNSKLIKYAQISNIYFKNMLEKYGLGQILEKLDSQNVIKYLFENISNIMWIIGSNKISTYIITKNKERE